MHVQAEKAVLSKELEAARGRATRLEADLAKARLLGHTAGQPHSELVEALGAARQQVEEAQQQLKVRGSSSSWSGCGVLLGDTSPGRLQSLSTARGSHLMCLEVRRGVDASRGGTRPTAACAALIRWDGFLTPL
jgi:hypothetical protein